METELDPRAPLVSQSCREAGSCDYGIYPLSNRFYMDQVTLDLSKFGKASLNSKGAGFCLLLAFGVGLRCGSWFMSLGMRAEQKHLKPHASGLTCLEKGRDFLSKRRLM